MANGNDSSQSRWCERLYEACAARLILYGRALGLTHAESEDVLHELFQALLSSEAIPEQPDHYCVRAFRNRALNYRRGLWRRLRREWESKRWFEPPAGTEWMERAAMDELTRLPLAQREVIVLKIWHGYTFQQIGQILNVSPNTVASRYRYGIEHVRIAATRAFHGEDHTHRETLAELDPSSPLCSP
jgi:RNA polymerase sigma-70 factor, ECF subfamily